LLGGWTGVDFSRFDADQPVEYIETNAIRSILQGFTQAGASRRWTIRDVAKAVGIGGGGPVLVGAPEQIADDLMQWVRAGADGFNIAYMVTPGTFKDFIDGVVPVLQRRGLMQTDYAEGTFREKLFGRGRARLLDRHPAARYHRR
jgi:alkanesulfonate monooxygenase SsuD/methylene tetrahydromethanopterin reductase-like flavin-dependent oxidoreductase (luciferase family)